MATSILPSAPVPQSLSRSPLDEASVAHVLVTDRDSILRRRHGMIEVTGNETRFHFRSWPCLVTPIDVWMAQWVAHRRPGQRLRLYYDEPANCPGFLSLKFIVSSRDAGLKRFLVALRMLDAVAEIKRAHGIVCQLASSRLSHRLALRLGWEQHLEPSGRHYIKRFDG